MRDPATDPAVRRRLAMVRYARSHSQSQAARHFGCCWATIHAAVQRVEEYERTGDVGVLQNKPRGQSDRTSPEVEGWVVDIHRESFEPERPQGRCYSAAKVARLLKEATQGHPQPQDRLAHLASSWGVATHSHPEASRTALRAQAAQRTVAD